MWIETGGTARWQRIRSFHGLRCTGSRRAGSHGHRELAQSRSIALGREVPQDGLGRPKIPRIINRLNYQNTLSNQRPDQQYTVLYNGRGSNLTSVVIYSEAAGIDAGLEQSGFVVDHGCYWYSCDDPEEAYFLSAVLNSPELDRLLKLIQTRGLWGARDIHRKVWKFRIPRYESTEPRHRELAEIGLRCHNVVKPLGYDLKDRSQSTGRRRAEVRTILESELESIDAVVRGLLRN